MKSCSYAECRPCHDKEYERKYIDRLLEYLSKKKDVSGTFIDIGAHTGLWSHEIDKFFMDNLIPASSIAVEADVENWQILEQNFQDRKSVSTINGAIWNERIVLGWNKCPHPARRRVIPISVSLNVDYYVQADTLDHTLLNASTYGVDAIKIDVEGAELQVLQGSKLLLLKQSPLVIVEVCEKQYRDYGYGKEKVYNNLAQLGYDFYEKVDKKNFDIEDENSVQLVFFSKGSKINE